MYWRKRINSLPEKSPVIIEKCISQLLSHLIEIGEEVYHGRPKKNHKKEYLVEHWFQAYAVIAKIKPRYTSICDLSYTKEMIIDYLEALKCRTDPDSLFVPPLSSSDSGGLTSSCESEEGKEREDDDEEKKGPPEPIKKEKKPSILVGGSSMMNIFDHPQYHVGEGRKDPRAIKLQ